MYTKVLKFFLLATTLIIMGCATLPPGSITKYEFGKNDIEILGPVTGEVTSHNVLFGLFTWGDDGYGKLMEKAKQKYPDTDGLANIYVNTQYAGFLPVYTNVTSTITATAVKIKK